MERREILCQIGEMRRHSLLARALSALLAGLLAAGPAAAGRPQKTAVVVVPYAGFPGVPDGAAARATELLAQELKGREELRVLPLKAPPAQKAADPVAQAQASLGKAAGLARKSRHGAAAEALSKAISLLTAKPSALDEAAGQLLSDAALQLAVERLFAGDEDGGDSALAQLVRLSPRRELNAADYPPAFLVELNGVRRRLLAAPRGSLRVLAPPGQGEARVLLDGRFVRAAPVLIEELIPGEHFVRVERGGLSWGEKVVAIAGVEARVAPQPGAEGPSAELASALLQGELDRAGVMAAGKIAREAGAQAAVFGAVVGSPSGVSVRSFLVAAKDDRLAALSPLELDAELLGGLVQMVKLGDEVVAKTATAPDEPLLPIRLGPAPSVLPQVAVAPPPPADIPLAPLVAQAPESKVKIMVPTAPARPVPEPPSGALVVPRQPQPDDTPPLAAEHPVKPPVAQRLQALEPDAVKTVREEPARKNHALLWTVAGVVAAGAAVAAGYYLYQGNQTPSTATVTTTWPP
jgi:hypothetical protein